VEHVNYRAQKAWKALHFAMFVLKNGNWNTNRLAYTSLLHPILEHWAAWWVPCREGQLHALDRVQKEAAQFTNHTNNSDWDNWPQCRTIARLCVHLKRTVGKGLGKLYVTGCEGLTV